MWIERYVYTINGLAVRALGTTAASTQFESFIIPKFQNLFGSIHTFLLPPFDTYTHTRKTNEKVNQTSNLYISKDLHEKFIYCTMWIWICILNIIYACICPMCVATTVINKQQEFPLNSNWCSEKCNLKMHSKLTKNTY